MGSEERKKELREKILEHLAFLTSSASGLFVEPREYGPLRCIDAMRRFIDLVLSLGVVEDEELVRDLQEMRKELDKGVVLLMYSTEEFTKFVSDINRELARKVKQALGI